MENISAEIPPAPSGFREQAIGVLPFCDRLASALQNSLQKSCFDPTEQFATEFLKNSLRQSCFGPTQQLAPRNSLTPSKDLFLIELLRRASDRAVISAAIGDGVTLYYSKYLIDLIDMYRIVCVLVASASK